MPTPIIAPPDISELPELKVWEKAIEVLGEQLTPTIPKKKSRSLKSRITIDPPEKRDQNNALAIQQVWAWDSQTKTFVQTPFKEFEQAIKAWEKKPSWKKSFASKKVKVAQKANRALLNYIEACQDLKKEQLKLVNSSEPPTFAQAQTLATTDSKNPKKVPLPTAYHQQFMVAAQVWYKKFGRWLKQVFSRRAKIMEETKFKAYESQALSEICAEMARLNRVHKEAILKAYDYQKGQMPTESQKKRGLKKEIALAEERAQWVLKVTQKYTERLAPEQAKDLEQKMWQLYSDMSKPICCYMENLLDPQYGITERRIVSWVKIQQACEAEPQSTSAGEENSIEDPAGSLEEWLAKEDTEADKSKKIEKYFEQQEKKITQWKWNIEWEAHQINKIILGKSQESLADRQVKYNAYLDQIKRQHRKLSLLFHDDPVNKQSGLSPAIKNQINKAFQALQAKVTQTKEFCEARYLLASHGMLGLTKDDFMDKLTELCKKEYFLNFESYIYALLDLRKKELLQQYFSSEIDLEPYIKIHREAKIAFEQSQDKIIELLKAHETEVVTWQGRAVNLDHTFGLEQVAEIDDLYKKYINGPLALHFQMQELQWKNYVLMQEMNKVNQEKGNLYELKEKIREQKMSIFDKYNVVSEEFKNMQNQLNQLQQQGDQEKYDQLDEQYKIKVNELFKKRDAELALEDEKYLPLNEEISILSKKYDQLLQENKQNQVRMAEFKELMSTYGMTEVDEFGAVKKGDKIFVGPIEFFKAEAQRKQVEMSRNDNNFASAPSMLFGSRL